MNKKKILLIGIYTYILGLILFNLFNFLFFIFLNEISDWELFSYNFYGSLVYYSGAMVIFSFLPFLFNLNKVSSLLIILLILLIEIPCIIVNGESLYITIFTSMISDNNYILLLYPSALIITYQISKRLVIVSNDTNW